jgi:hypothetical protein
MKKQTYIRLPLVFTTMVIVVMAFNFGCGPGPGRVSPKQETDQVKEQIFKEAKEALQKAQAEDVALLSPKNFTRANQFYQKALEDYEKRGSLKKIRENLKRTMDHIGAAFEASKISRIVLEDLIQMRGETIALEIPKYAADAFSKAEQKFREVAIKIEDGDVKSAKSIARDAEKEYRRTVIEVLKKVVLADARKRFKENKDTIPKESFRKAKAELYETEDFIKGQKGTEFAIGELFNEVDTQIKQALTIAGINVAITSSKPDTYIKYDIKTYYDKLAKPPYPDIYIKDKCLRAVSSLNIPMITKLGGISANNAKNKNNPPTFSFAVIEIEIQDFDLDVPPEIKIYDETTNQLIDNITFYPRGPCLWKRITARMPIFLAYDTNPWNNVNQEPDSRISRIELHMPLLNHVETVYAKLKEGIFVVPVVWHNIAESSTNGAVYVDNQDVIDLFWTPPTIKGYVQGAIVTDVNTIWAQAGIQFRLINTNVPFSKSSIPTHIVYPPDKSSVMGNSGILGWKANFNSPDGVDIYAIYKVKYSEDFWGIGNCFGQGHVLIKADNPKFLDPGFSDNSAAARAALVAHEFGHYLGGLGHEATVYNNLMYGGLGDWKLEQYQIDQVRKEIKKRGYNENM